MQSTVNYTLLYGFEADWIFVLFHVEFNIALPVKLKYNGNIDLHKFRMRQVVEVSYC